MDKKNPKEIIDFVEKYALVDGESIKLKKHQKRFIHWLSKCRDCPDIRILKRRMG